MKLLETIVALIIFMSVVFYLFQAAPICESGISSKGCHCLGVKVPRYLTGDPNAGTRCLGVIKRSRSP